jgi:ribosome-binding factor A
MPKEFSRTQRVGDYLRRELAGFIQTQMRDPRVGMVMVNEVEVSRDLAHAKVFVTVLGKDTEEEAREVLTVLNDAAGFLRSRLAQDSSLRTTPRLHFVFDSSVLRGQKLSNLIDQAVAQDHHPLVPPTHHSQDTSNRDDPEDGGSQGG